MKRLKILLVFIILIGIVGFVAFNMIHVEMDIDDLPATVYEENDDLFPFINSKLLNLFFFSVDDEYTVVEEITNLVILDSIHENLNQEYTPLSNCDTVECNYIVSNEDYYISYMWAELSEDNQMILHISVGSDRFIHINTIVNLYLDVDINYLGFEISLTLDKLFVNEMEVSEDLLDKIISNLDKEKIKKSLTTGELDLDEYTYTLPFSLLP